MASSKATALAIVAVIVVAVGAYAAWTYPRNVVSFPVSFTIGADVKEQQFTVPALDSQVQVVITVSGGNAIWRASIISGNSTLWIHDAAQGGQTTYNSGWMLLQPGDYNFTFWAGSFDVNAQVAVMAKGGFW